MGWTSQPGMTRAQIVKAAVSRHDLCDRQTGEPNGEFIMAHEWAETTIGVWMATARYGRDGNMIGPRFLAIRLIDKDSDGELAWKDMDEAAGPYATDCPARVFDAVDALPDDVGGYAVDFRKRIEVALERSV